MPCKAVTSANRHCSVLIQAAIALIAFAFLPQARATVSALGTLTETATSASFNTFALTLQNTSTAGNTLETFWFAWVPGKDYLDTDPLSVQLPANWTESITNAGSGDGFAIKFTTTSAPIAVGSSLSGFGFTSVDSLAQVSGSSNFYPTTPVTTSEVSTGSAFGGTPSSSFVVAVVPEPAPLALVGCAGAFFLCFRKRRWR
jgi:hypothetical protein